MAKASTEIFQQTARGTSWSIGGGVVARVIQLVVSICLARLLTPELFGQMAMILVFVGVFEIVTHLGFGLALIQRKELHENHRSTSFWGQVLVGFFLTLFFYMMAPWLNRFYGVEGLTRVARVMSLVFVTSGLYGTHEALLKRAMKFRLLAWLEIFSTLLAGTFAIIIGISGGGIWSLVCFHLGLNVFEALFAILFLEWQPGLVFGFQALQELFGFSFAYLGARVFKYGVRTGDDLLVGRILGATELGLYSRSYSLVTLPYRRLTKKIRKVMLPALSRVQDSDETLRQLYYSSLSLLAYMIFPLLFGLWVVADPFIVGLFGKHWQGMVPLVRVLVFFGVLSSLNSTFSWVLLAKGNSALNFYWELIKGGLILVGFSSGVFWGTLGVARGLVVASAIAFLPGLFFLRRAFSFSLLNYLRIVTGSFLLTVFMGAIVWLIQYFLPNFMPPWSVLILSVCSGGLIYWAGSEIFDLRGYSELKIIIFNEA